MTNEATPNGEDNIDPVLRARCINGLPILGTTHSDPIAMGQYILEYLQGLSTYPLNVRSEAHVELILDLMSRFPGISQEQSFLLTVLLTVLPLDVELCRDGP